MRERGREEGRGGKDEKEGGGGRREFRVCVGVRVGG